MRRLSTKESRAPFRAGSFSGSPTERFSSVATGKTRQSSLPSRKRAQLPLMRANTTGSGSVSRLAPWA